MLPEVENAQKACLEAPASVPAGSVTCFSDRFLRALGEFSPDFGLLSKSSSCVIILKRSVPMGQFHIQPGTCWARSVLRSPAT